MADFFDWLTAFDAGAAADRLSRQHGLTPAEMRRSTDALVPAFMLGLRPLSADPAAWQALMRQASAVQAGSLDPAALRRGGEAMLALLFGAETAAAVARQASLLTGQPTEAMARLMPPLAGLALPSLLAMANDAGRAGGGAGATPADAAGQLLAETMRRSANAVDAFSRPSAQAAPTPAAPRTPGDFLSAAFASGQPFPAPFGLPVWPAMDPFGFFAARENPAAERSRPAAPEPDEAAPLARMISSAQSLQAEYMQAMLALFEGGKERKG